MGKGSTSRRQFQRIMEQRGERRQSEVNSLRKRHNKAEFDRIMTRDPGHQPAHRNKYARKGK